MNISNPHKRFNWGPAKLLTLEGHAVQRPHQRCVLPSRPQTPHTHRRCVSRAVHNRRIRGALCPAQIPTVPRRESLVSKKSATTYV
ncbi:hypothetical protein AVEN_224303-1 [Araneus ventricosus]|uniref:Uncharacterized protein n=1 Tax=Araneus ventricosus TaxID=182803 RepID=A0A4Y2MCP2_ARAVE|nr:hypothetical protein AVEN_224303-1 [Araneus ventricosus]